MGSFTEENYLRQKAHSLCKGLALRLDEFVDEFPAGQPVDLINTVKLFLRQLETDLATTTDLKILRLSCFLIKDLTSTLEWLDNAHTAQTPRAVVQLLNKTSSVLFGKSAAVLVSPSIVY